MTLSSKTGLEVTILNLGAAIQSIRVPVNVGRVNVVLGYPALNDYWFDTVYMGATVGRFANRIRGARFSLNGRRYELEANEQETGNCLHGGYSGLDKRYWDLSGGENERAVVCRYTSPDGEGGFPGTLRLTVKYQLTAPCSLAVDYLAESDTDTVVSLTNHAYFNLDDGKGTIDAHELCLRADQYTPMDANKIPNGELSSVGDSEFDFRQPRLLRARNGSPLTFDNNFSLADGAGELREVAELFSRDSGIRMRMYTTQVGLQLYTGDYLHAPFRARQGLCLEAQAFPDAPNQPTFPSAQLAAGDSYRQRTVYEFFPPSG